MEKTYLQIAKKLRKDQEMATSHAQLTVADNIANTASNWKTLINPRHHLLQSLLELKKGDKPEETAHLPSITHQPTHTIPIDHRYLVLLDSVVAFVDLESPKWCGGEHFRNEIREIWPQIYTMTNAGMIQAYYDAVRDGKVKIKLEQLEGFLLYMIYHSCDESVEEKMDDQELMVVAKAACFFISMLLDGTQKIL